MGHPSRHVSASAQGLAAFFHFIRFRTSGGGPRPVLVEAR